MKDTFVQIREVRVSYHTTNEEKIQITQPAQVARFIRSTLTDNSREHVVALYLDGAHQIACYSVISIGAANSCTLHPREVYQRAILSGACALILAHNHPSGQLDASREDWEVTRRMLEASRILGIKLLDHIIVTDDGFASLSSLSEWNNL